MGTGTPTPRIDRFGPSILLEAGQEKLLFDCGRGVTQRLWQLKMPLSAPTAVFLTHLHSDHITGIPDLWLSGWLAPLGHRAEPFRVWGPTGTQEMMANLEKAYQADIRIRTEDEKLPPRGISVEAKDISQGVVYEKNGVKVTAFDVDHGAVIKPSLGYRIDYGGHSVVLSGDTRPSDNLIQFSKGADVLIHEVALAKPELLNKSEAVRRIIAHHTTPDKAGAVFARVKPKLAVYSHLVMLKDSEIGEPTISDIVALTRKTYEGPLQVGEDLMEIDIGNRIDVHPAVPPSR
ncbi:MAG: MBL fold metallo-hydrolase [Bryobacteraceae bacterium]